MPTLRILHIAGARPQFAKVAAVSRAVQAVNAAGTQAIEERLLHTGQHYDSAMSQVFFDELGLRHADYNLAVGSGNPAFQTARALEGIYQVCGEWRPDWIVAYGDTNATLAGGLAALQRQIRLAHVEAGVRTGELWQAEELNRVVVDRICQLRCCCTQLNLDNLRSEQLAAGSHFTGDTMLDNYRFCLPQMDAAVMDRLGVRAGEFILCTLHRAENTDDRERLRMILDGLQRVQAEVAPLVFPVHPRTRHAAVEVGAWEGLERSGIILLEPQGFKVMQALLQNSRCALTDSGGLQREAYFAGRHSVILWEFATWPELVTAGWATTGGIAPEQIVQRCHAAALPQPAARTGLFGDGAAGTAIVELLLASA